MRTPKSLTEALIAYFRADKEKPLDEFIGNHPAQKESIYTLVSRLEQRGILAKRRLRDGRRLKSFFRLTGKADGKEGAAPSKPRPKWDGYWRLTVFDIPEEEKALRDHLRQELKRRGFYMLQLSVWVTPYPVDSELEEIIEEIGVRYYVRFMVIQEIDHEKDLLTFFNL